MAKSAMKSRSAKRSTFWWAGSAGSSGESFFAKDSQRPLLQANEVPGDVVVDHQPAELQVDALAGGFGGDEDLGRFLELALGTDARAGRVTIVDLHAAVDLREREPHSRSLPSGRPSRLSPAR